MSAPTALVLDDDPNSLDILRAVLTEAGFRMYEALDGAEAISVCKNYGHQIDLIIADLILRGLSGPAIVKEIKDIYPYSHLPVLYMSSRDREELLRWGLLDEREIASGRTPFLQKSFSAVDLKVTINSILHSRTTCAMCDELQERALEAMHAHIRVLERLSAAEIKAEDEPIAALECALRVARQIRQRATLAYESHLATHVSPRSAA